MEAPGLSGMVTMIDGKTGRPRTAINIEKAAKVRAEEGPNALPKVREISLSDRRSAPVQRRKELARWLDTHSD
jgi:hypothetical protein